MQIIIALLAGLAAGLHTSTWGMYKDAPHEGFSWATYFRSTWVGTLYGPLIAWIFHLDMTYAANFFLLWGSVYALERFTMEVYKTFIRNEDQSKYSIPMQLSVFGKPIKSHATRLFFGLIYVLAVSLLVFGIYSLNLFYHNQMQNLNVFLLLLTCSVMGWVSAFGGAWKDAPIEGFETFKFFRSPAIAFFYAFIASLFSDHLVIISAVSIGLTVATIETYKSFFFLDRPRGKFQGMPVTHPLWLEKRKKFVPLYIGIWLIVVISLIIAINQRPEPSTLMPF
ncbi:MAG TPA: hypothetical protein PKC30_01790 [Saprospiraceae bacterium]|nr:hypothetical protein [Saprospiraceae bacterium]